MSHRYSPHSKYNAAVDPLRCAQAVHDSGRGCGFHQCRNKRKVGDWCATHDPNAIKARRDKSERKYRADLDRARAVRIVTGLQNATTEQLHAEIARRKETP